MKIPRLVVLIGSIFLILALMACSAPASTTSTVSPTQTATAEKIIWKNSLPGPQDDPLMQTIQWFYDEVSKRSQGRFECQAFYNGSLITSLQSVEALGSGLIQAGELTPGDFPSEMALSNIVYLPGLFPFPEENKQMWTTYWNILNDWNQTPALKQEIEKLNAVYVIDFTPILTTIFSESPIQNLQDLKGKKIRAIGPQTQMFKDLGSAPIALDVPDMYDALSKGTVDGIAHLWLIYNIFHIYEVAPYWTTGVNFGITGSYMVFNKEAYEALPEDIKGIFQEVLKEFPSHFADVLESTQSAVLKTFNEKGVKKVAFSDEDATTVAKKSKEICKAYVEQLEKDGKPGKEAFNSLQDIIQKYVPDYTPYHIE